MFTFSKHSHAKNALLQVAEYEDAFTLIAEDDGYGFNYNQPTKMQGLGMSGIQSKISYFDGSIAYDKNVPQGLIVTIEIPIIHDKKQGSAGR